MDFTHPGSLKGKALQEIEALVNETIKAGESRIIRAVYDPNAHGPAGVGPIDRFLILTDSSGSKLELEIKAIVTP